MNQRSAPARLLVLVALLAVTVCAKRVRAANPDQTVAILAFRFVGTAPVLRRRVLHALDSALVEQGYRVLRGPRALRPLRASSRGAGCLIGPCLCEVGRMLGAGRVLVGSLIGYGDSYDSTLSLLETRAGQLVGQVTANCDACTFSEAAKMVSSLVSELHRRAQRQLDRQGWLTVRSDPTGAEVWLDEVPFGPTPLERLMSPGKHAVRIVHATGVARQLVVNVEPKKHALVSEKLTMPIVRSSARLGHPPDASRSVRRWPAWVALGSGAGMVGAGAALLAVEDSGIPGSLLVGLGTAALFCAGILFWQQLDPIDASHVRSSVGIVPQRAGLSITYAAATNW